MNKLLAATLLMFSISCGASETTEKPMEHNDSTETAAVSKSIVAEQTDTPDANNKKQTEATELPQKKEEVKEITHCYLRAEGKNNEDTSIVRIITKGDEVTGNYVVSYEGSATSGTLEGTKKGNIITANWNYVYGQNFFSIPVAFKTKRRALFQKPTAVKDGKPFIPEEGDYDVEYIEVNCSKVKF